MSNDKQQIAEKIRDGSYFTDARNWYAIKYLYPVTERSLMFLFAIAAIFAFLPIATVFYESTDTLTKVAFPMYVEDSTEYFTVMTPLAKQHESAQSAVTQYLIADYIKTREEYIYKNLTGEKIKRLLKKIKFSSTKQVLNEYVSYMTDNNPYSPLVRYKDHTNRYIEIKSLSFLDNSETSGKANVIFEATEVVNGGKKQTSRWEVVINYRLPDIATIARTGAPLRFVVAYYRVRPIDSSAKQDLVPEQNTKIEKKPEVSNSPEAPKAEAPKPETPNKE